MKQILMIVSVLFLTLGLTSCGGYDLKKCEQLQEKIQGGEELTQDDYADMISQAQGLNVFLSDIADKLANVKNGDEFKKLDKESAEQGKFYQRFISTLESANALDELEGDNVDAYKKLMEANETLNEKITKAFEAAYKAGGADALGQ